MLNTKNNSLKKELGTLELFCIASGAMISSGLFILPALAFEEAGPAVIISYVIAALIVIPAMLTQTELATAMPRSGGTYFFVHRSLGPLFGTFAGFANWLSIALKSAFALVGIGIFLEPLVPFVSPFTVKIIASGFTLLFMFLNIFSVKESGKFQVILVIMLIAVLIFFNATSSLSSQFSFERFTPFNPKGWDSVIMVSGMIFISFGGLTKIASVAEEVRNPGRVIPLGMFTAFIVVTIFYALSVFTTIGVLDSQTLMQSRTPLSSAAEAVLGQPGFLILSIAAMTAFITTANAGLLAASRTPMAMSRDNLLPPFFAKVSVRFGTPIVSIIITAVFMLIVILFLDLKHLVKVASTMMLILFAFVNVSGILMRTSRLTSYRPQFKAPLFPVIQILGAAIYLVLIADMGLIPLILTGGFFLLSIIWYFAYSRSRIKKDSALIHIVERITSKEIRSEELTNELKDILLERDELEVDRFHQIIEQATIMDVQDGVVDREDLFSVIAKEFARKFNLEAKEVSRLLHEREEQSTTVIQPGLAIPHVIVPGEKLSDIVVIRSKKGILFTEGKEPVRIVFALAGSKDERNFHLQALMAIAQIVQDKDFKKRWMKVSSKEELRHLILLAQRVRQGKI